MKTIIWSAVILVAVGLLTVAVVKREVSLPAGEPSLHVLHLGAMSTARAAHQATMLPNGEVLITGGCADRGCETILASTERYNPATRTFRAAAPMTTPRASHAAVLLPDGRVLVAGGWTGDRATAGAEIYDPAENTWTPAGDMNEARASLIAVPLADGRVLIMGGGSGALGDRASAEVFDPDADTFTPTQPMRTNHYLATPLADGRVLVTGGQDADGTILRSAEVFDPATNTFEPTGDMSVPRVKHAAAGLPDGRVLIIGGSDAQGYRGRYTSTEVYDPATGSFSPGPTMRWGRHKIRDAVAALPSGEVLVAGGAPHPELFDPGEHLFVASTDSLDGPQMFATATLLPGGDVLVLGGYDERTRPSAAAWLVGTGW